MALKCDVILDSGITVDNAYLRIINFAGNESSLDFTLNIYVDEMHFKEGKPAAASLTYNMPFDKSRNLFSQAYDYLISLNLYKNAVEA